VASASHDISKQPGLEAAKSEGFAVYPPPPAAATFPRSVLSKQRLCEPKTSRMKFTLLFGIGKDDVLVQTWLLTVDWWNGQ